MDLASAYDTLRSSKQLQTLPKQHDSSVTKSLQHTPPSPSRSGGLTARKRKCEEDCIKVANSQEPPQKQSRSNGTIEERGWSTIDNWIEQTTSPDQAKRLLAMADATPAYSATSAHGLKRKISQSNTTSYNQGVRDGKLPASYSLEHEHRMQEFGMHMGQTLWAPIADKSQELWKEVLKQQYIHPPWFRLDRFQAVRDLVSLRNESSIVAHLTPFFLPSPEILTLNGHLNLEHRMESRDAIWGRCAPIYGKSPKPNIALGVSRQAFDRDEISKLEMLTSIDTPTQFSEEMYFPYLICEVKSARPPLREAERQAMHSASIAVKALLTLHNRNADAEDLSGQYLVFSIVHNHEIVRVFGHYSWADGDTVTYHRRPLYSLDLTGAAEDQWTRPYQIVLAICQLHFRNHFQTIRNALAKQPIPLNNSRETAATASSQDTQFKRPPLPPFVKLQQENERLNDNMTTILRRHDEQARRYDEQVRRMEHETEQLKEQLKSVMEQMKQQS